MTEVSKYGQVVPMSIERLLPKPLDLDAAIRRYAEATPEQRAQWQREALEQRAAEREARGIDLTDPEAILLALGEKFGWSPEYVRHLVQPYCDCDGDRDGGWDYCPHARDLGLDR